MTTTFFISWASVILPLFFAKQCSKTCFLSVHFSTNTLSYLCRLSFLPAFFTKGATTGFCGGITIHRSATRRMPGCGASVRVSHGPSSASSSYSPSSPEEKSSSFGSSSRLVLCDDGFSIYMSFFYSFASFFVSCRPNLMSICELRTSMSCFFFFTGFKLYTASASFF